MWHLFWHNQYFRFFILLPCLLLGREVFSQILPEQKQAHGIISFKTEQVPGILFPLEQTVNKHTELLNALTTKALTNPAKISALDTTKPITLDPLMVSSLILHSESSYLSLAKQNECNFYSSLENNLLRISSGTPTNLVIRATAKGKETEEVFSIEKNSLLSLIYQKSCISNRDISSLFGPKNLPKTLQSFTFSVPKTQKQCENIIKEWSTNSYLPYLCGLHEKVEEGNRADLQMASTPASNLLGRRLLGSKINVKNEINSLTTLFQRNYIGALCQGIDDHQKFCAPFLADEIWQKIVAGEKPAWLIDRQCEVLMDKKPINGRDLIACAGKLKNNSAICSTLGNKDYPALFPKPNCNEISDAFLAQKLTTRYSDCPANLDNGTITNGFRLWAHFSKEDFQVSPVECSQLPALTFAKASLQVDPKEGWPLAICYQNRAREQRECLPYVPGPHSTSQMAENKVISKILIDNFGMGTNDECKIVRSSQYNPSLLEYKNGCFIVYEDNICTLTNCRRKIVFNEKTIEGLEFTGRAIFSYFPDSIAQTKSTLQSLLRETLKADPREIRNLTELNFYLKELDNAVIHGVGCAEEILPSFFIRETLNQCTPLPFILDGISKRGNGDDIVVRTAIDDIHSPRLIPWNYIFNSVMSFQKQHLLKTWTMYGIKI